MNKTITYAVVAAVLAGGLGFYGGYIYAGKKGGNTATANRNNYMANSNRNNRNSGANARGNMSSGEIIKKEDSNITIKLSDGGSKVVYFTSSTTISKSVEGSASDLEVGKTVMVSGSAASDGSMSAQYIQLRPAGQQSMFGGQGGNNANGGNKTNNNAQDNGNNQGNAGPGAPSDGGPDGGPQVQGRKIRQNRN